MSQNVLFDKARKDFAEGQHNWSTDDLRCLLLNDGYSLDVGHTMLSAIDGAAGGPRDYSPSGDTADFLGYQLENAAVADNGAVYADPRRFVTVQTALNPVNAILLYKFVTSATDSPLIYYAGIATGLPIQPNGGDIIVTWSSGTNRIFRL
jgi:hypothetical protein